MNTIRRLSRHEASEKATAIARQLAESTDMKGWTWELGRATPDTIETESVGKTPRHWISLVSYSREGSFLDGPAVIHVDLQSEAASWRESP